MIQQHQYLYVTTAKWKLNKLAFGKASGLQKCNRWKICSQKRRQWATADCARTLRNFQSPATLIMHCTMDIPVSHVMLLLLLLLLLPLSLPLLLSSCQALRSKEITQLCSTYTMLPHQLYKTVVTAIKGPSSTTKNWKLLTIYILNTTQVKTKIFIIYACGSLFTKEPLTALTYVLCNQPSQSRVGMKECTKHCSKHENTCTDNSVITKTAT